MDSWIIKKAKRLNKLYLVFFNVTSQGWGGGKKKAKSVTYYLNSPLPKVFSCALEECNVSIFKVISTYIINIYDKVLLCSKYNSKYIFVTV